MLVLPRIGSPAARTRATTVASYGGTQPSRILDPQVVGSPAVASTSLTAIGTPSSAEAVRPAARRSSDACAAASAPSVSTWRNACTAPSTAAIRSSAAWVSSTLVVAPEARSSASSAAVLRRSAVTARPPGSAGPRSAAARPRALPTAPAPVSGTARRRPRGTRWSAGSACEVGGTSASATPWIDATDSRITDSWGARWSSSASVRSIRARSARWATSSRDSDADMPAIVWVPGGTPSP